MFRAVDVVVVNKIDLLPHLDFDLPKLLDNLNRINPRPTVIQASARTGQGSTNGVPGYSTATTGGPQ